MKFINFDEAVNELIDKENIVLFCGAGISFNDPSNCPIWNQLVYNAIKRASNNHGLDEYYSIFEKFQNKIKIEHICQSLYDNLNENFWGLFDILITGYPNTTHKAIAKLLKENKVKYFITTNYDIYVEKALIEENIDCEVYTAIDNKLLDRIKNKRKLRVKAIIKPHGTIEERSSIKATMRHAGYPLHANIEELLKYSFENNTVLFVGYSGRDDDFYPLILKYISTAKQVYWALFNDKDEIRDNSNLELLHHSATSDNCKFILTGRADVLFSLVKKDKMSNSLVKIERQKSNIADNQGIFIDRWTSSINIHCWELFFIEILLSSKIQFSIDNLLSFINKLGLIISNPLNPLAEAKSYRNKALLLAQCCHYIDFLNEESFLKFKMCSFQFLKSLLLNIDIQIDKMQLVSELKEMRNEYFTLTLDKYLLLGRKKEIIECISTFIEFEEANKEFKWRGNTYTFWVMNIAGKFYDKYFLSLAYYTNAFHYLIKGRYDLAIKYSIKSAGFSIKSGNRLTLLSSLEILKSLVKKGEYVPFALENIEDYIQYLIGNSLKVNSDFLEIKEKFEKQAKKTLTNYIKGEIILFLVIQTILMIFAWFRYSDKSIFIKASVIFGLVWIIVRIWLFTKKLRYTQIDR